MKGEASNVISFHHIHSYLLFEQMHFSDSALDQADHLSRLTTDNLKGVLAILIVMSHLAHRIQPSYLSTLLRSIAYMVVSVFFFLSGFGLMRQYKQRGDSYLDTFFSQRYRMILLPYLMVNILYFLLLPIFGKDITVMSVLLDFRHGNTLVTNSWYIIAIMFFYLLFYLSMRLSRGRFSLGFALLSLGCVLYILSCIIMGFANWWYNSCLAFLLGILWANKESSILVFFRAHGLWKKAGLFIFCYLSFVSVSLNFEPYVGHLLDCAIGMGLQQLSCLFFSAGVILVSGSVHMENPITKRVGSISMELYLIHGLVLVGMDAVRIYISSDTLFCTMAILVSIVLAVALHVLFQRMLHWKETKPIANIEPY